MADSPQVSGDGLVRVSVLSGGTDVDDSTQLVSISVTREINRIPHATITLLDGDMASGAFPVSDGTSFAPGAEIEIKAGYDTAEETIFKGIVISHSISISGENYARLVVFCQDKAVAMTVGRKSALFTDMTDSDAISSIVSAAGLSADCDVTDTTHGELVQHDCSDWDFVLSRADANGLVTTVDDGVLTIAAPEEGSAALSVTWGIDLMEFHGDIDARSQLAAVDSHAWDPATLAAIESTASTQTINAQGDLTSGTLAQTIGLGSYRLQTPAPLAKSEITTWAKSQQVRSALARIRGRMRFQGSAAAAVGTVIELNGVGNRFDGNAYLTSVTHTIGEGAWTTQAEFGLDPERFTQRPDLMTPAASGRLPGISGLHVGLVTKLAEDPASWQRIQVQLPLWQDQPTVWARLAKLQASDGFGGLFLPHIGDEVVVGFFNDDPSFPVVLGSLYGPKHAPPYAFTDDNFIDAIVTKESLKIEMDDEKKVITVETPAGNSIVLSDDQKSITLADQTGNTIVMDTSGITLDSPGDINITAVGNIAISATQDLTGQGLNVDLAGNVGFKANGSATAELSAGGQTTVKGALVMIN